MKISKLIILFLLSFFVLNCVETLITVSVFPDGAYHMKFHSKGDKKDIYDQDFSIPTNDPWLHEIQESEDDSIHIITSQSVLSGLTVFHPIDEGPGIQRHPIIVNKEEKLFSTSYNLLKIFKGRGVSKKYPLLSEAMNNISSDSIDLLVETEIIMHCLKMGMEDIRGEFAIKELTEKRILNHFRGVFYKAEEQGNLFGIYYNTSHIGNINIKHLSQKSCYIGFILGDKKFRSKGISSYAVSLAISKCFNYYKYNRIYSNCDIRNISSFKLLKKNNFKKIKNIPSFIKRQNNDTTKKRKLIYFCLSKKNITKSKII